MSQPLELSRRILGDAEAALAAVKSDDLTQAVKYFQELSQLTDSQLESTLAFLQTNKDYPGVLNIQRALKNIKTAIDGAKKALSDPQNPDKKALIRALRAIMAFESELNEIIRSRKNEVSFVSWEATEAAGLMVVRWYLTPHLVYVGQVLDNVAGKFMWVTQVMEDVQRLAQSIQKVEQQSAVPSSRWEALGDAFVAWNDNRGNFFTSLSRNLGIENEWNSLVAKAADKTPTITLFKNNIPGFFDILFATAFAYLTWRNLSSYISKRREQKKIISIAKQIVDPLRDRINAMIGSMSELQSETLQLQTRMDSIETLAIELKQISSREQGLLPIIQDLQRQLGQHKSQAEQAIRYLAAALQKAISEQQAMKGQIAELVGRINTGTNALVGAQHLLEEKLSRAQSEVEEFAHEAKGIAHQIAGESLES